MAQAKDIPSLDEIIQADRKRRRNEQLADRIFGKGRRSSATGVEGRKPFPGPGASLASRVGVTKRSLSANPKVNPNRRSDDDSKVSTTRVSKGPQPPRTTSALRIEQANRLYDNIRAERSHNGASNGYSDISIRGMAGPYTVVASNFAPGTTAADIEAVMSPVGGEMTSCRLVSSQPTVIAEMVFIEREGADNVVSMFNNKKADGRLLYVYMKNGPPHSFQSRPRTVPEPASRYERDTMDVDGDKSIRSQEKTEREVRPNVQYADGRYGFPETRSGDVVGSFRGGRGKQGLFSDRMVHQSRTYRP